MSATERATRINTTLQLTVVEGLSAPRGAAYVSPAALDALECQPGDVILIQSARATVARIYSTPPDGTRSAVAPATDGEIQMEGLVRQNAGAALGELVSVRRAAPQPAVSVALTPANGSAALSDAEMLHVARELKGLAVVAGDLVRVSGMGLAAREFQVFSTNPATAVILEGGTSVRIQATGATTPRVSQITYEDIGGLGQELTRIREQIELPLKHPELFDRLGIEAPKGVLLYGPPGTGKTLIARAVATESGARFYSVSGPEIIDKFYGESEAQLRRVFTEAQKTAPSVIFIDEIDAIAPKRSEVFGEVEKRVVGQLLTLMDGLRARGQLVVVAATNRPDALDPALRRPGRFDREINLHAPDYQGRIEILRIHSRDMPLAHDVDLGELARITPGFVGADLAALCRESAMSALRRTFPRAVLTNGSIPSDHLLALTVTMSDFLDALRSIEPSAAREVAVELSRTTWDDVGGLEDVKRSLVETIQWPLRYPELYAAMDLEPTRGVLLAGPPGTGKTLIARALATACQANFISVKGPELLSKWVGESERGVRETFQRARQVAPCVLFLDEMDALAPQRGGAFDAVGDRLIGQLLTELDGIEGRRGVIVVGATNRPELIDPAVLRSGRFDLVVELPLPDREARRAILTIHTRKRALAANVSLDSLAKKTDGFSGADLEAACRRAANLALAEWMRERGASAEAENRATTPLKTNSPQIEMRHFEAAFAEAREK
ncbi:MAG TPA: CDC48 family AAA ATPase [Ktedonobacterales bacterium]|nr:CDC48 family AAA ATPase [Ktedonobacterales bacterium]